MYDFKPLQKKVEESEEWLRREYRSLRTGRATPALLDGIQVESYGARVSLSQSASVGVEDARTLRVIPWDISQVKEVEKAIANANLGAGISADEKGVRVIFPELTSERRESLVKIAKKKLEDARQSIRIARDEVWSEIQAQEKAGQISEDEKFRSKDELQKQVEKANQSLEEAYSKKEAEIHS
ncbi:ribosome recycling factor [bacterium]|nr:ribosome recycling factor [bacterium]|tara:strand:- start:9823 stop:10371 length:549 start_codon:yes stop_codon:yes gene_type:complete